MTINKAIHRLALILEFLNEHKYLTLKKLNELLSESDYGISERTLSRDFKKLDDEFGIAISYDKQQKAYFIDKKQSVEVESFLRLIELVTTTNLLVNSLKEGKNSLKYIAFDNQKLLGIEHLKPLLEAIKNNEIVKIKHRGFEKNKAKEHIVQPYFLKEYLNRWYLVGTKNNESKLYKFGIDRIKDVKFTGEKFVRNPDINPDEYFDFTIGISLTENKPQIVELSFTPQQGKYIKTLPLHHSQEILVDNDKELRISLKVIRNFELSQEILKYGDTVKVLKPKELVDEIKRNYRNALKKYE